MGEEADWEREMNELGAEAETHIAEARRLAEKEALDKEAAFSNGVQNYWQEGCTLKLKDIIWCCSLKTEGKVCRCTARPTAHAHHSAPTDTHDVPCTSGHRFANRGRRCREH
jgi:hypothetical protein